MLRDRLKRLLKKSRLIRQLHTRYRSRIPIALAGFTTEIAEITPFGCRRGADGLPRLNLLVPSISREHVFGGISTALKFFEKLRQTCAWDGRIIVTDAPPGAADLAQFAGFEPATPEDDPGGSCVVAFNDRYNRTVPVRAGDVFVATSWWTAFSALETIRWQRREYASAAPLVYLIQDFEPGFYPWSSHYALAMGTYRTEEPVAAVFNSSLLADYFVAQGLRFPIECRFEPQLNARLRQRLESRPPRRQDKRRLVLVYGRPSVARNAFTLIVAGLRLWVWRQPDIAEWQILSAGEAHPDVDLGKGKTLRALGKLSLDEYADRLTEAAVGVSLMVSPHPSYPPLEMAVFGARVITNGYANKDLSHWHENIISLDPCNPESIAAALIEAAAPFVGGATAAPIGRLLQEGYLSAAEPFPFAEQLAGDLIRSVRP